MAVLLEGVLSRKAVMLNPRVRLRAPFDGEGKVVARMDDREHGLAAM
jgi:hypothetical protein